MKRYRPDAYLYAGGVPGPPFMQEDPDGEYVSIEQLRERIEQLPRFDPSWSVGPTTRGPYLDRDDVLAILNSQQGEK